MAIGVSASGSNITTGAASASAAIPNDQSGTRARFVRIAVTESAYVKLGPSGVTAAAGDMLVTLHAPVIVQAGGFTHVAAIQVSGAGICNLTPLESA